MRQAIIGGLSLLVALAGGLIAAGCRAQRTSRIEPVYDAKTGVLRLLKYDTNGDGRTDTWRYMDGARVIRVEIDRDEDGTIDRWEYYDANQMLEKIGISLAGDGQQDAWTYLGADGQIARVESSPRHNGKIERVEHFEHGRLSRAEEDTDGDGRIDKWETYDTTRLVVVSYDTAGRGVADRRVVYGDAGSARIEVDARGDGHFEPVVEQPAGGGITAQR